jgi:hypothetical protein
MVIQYQLLLMNVETIVCYDDIVFFKSPIPLLKNDTDFQLQSEGDDRQFSERFEYEKLNVGFFQVIPSELAIRFVHHWTNATIRQTRLLEQYLLGEMIEPYRNKDRTGLPRQVYDITSFVHVSNATLSVTWFDPLDVPTGKLFHWEKEATMKVARVRNITRPYVFHAAWLMTDQKPVAFAQNNVWMVENHICDPDKVIDDPWPPLP